MIKQPYSLDNIVGVTESGQNLPKAIRSGDCMIFVAIDSANGGDLTDCYAAIPSYATIPTPIFLCQYQKTFSFSALKLDNRIQIISQDSSNL